MKNHVIGDSHGNYLFARAENAILHCIPGRTMHRVARDGVADLIRDIYPNLDDTLIFAFGEIDVRCHMLRIAALKGWSLHAEADDLTARYVAALNAAVLSLSSRPKICVLGIVPPIEPLVQNPILPHSGTLEERLAAWFLINEALRARVCETGFTFVAIPKIYRARDGSLKRHFSDGIAHIAKDCTEPAVRAIEKALNCSLAFRPLPARRHIVRSFMRQIAVLNSDYAVLWTLGESNVDR